MRSGRIPVGPPVPCFHHHSPCPFSGVKSQLHTPLSSKQLSTDDMAEINPLAAAKGAGASAAPPGPSAPAAKSPVDALLQHFLLNCRVPPQNSYVPETVEGLQQVADAGDWRSVVDISGKLISNEDFVVAANETLSLSLQLRFEGLFRMKLFDDLSLEISKVLGSQSGLDENRRGPTVYVIVSLTVLLAEIKSLTGRGSEALEQLYRLRANLRIMSSAVTGGNDNLIIQWWQMKVWNQIINILLRQRQWHLALHELSELLFEIRSLRDLSQDGAFSEIEGNLCSNKYVPLRAEIIVLCRISRILLQIGAIAEATHFFEEAIMLVQSHPGQVDNCCSNHVRLTQGLILHIQNQYEAAVEVFGALSQRIDPPSWENIELSKPSTSSYFFDRPPKFEKNVKAEYANALLWHVSGGIVAFEGNMRAAAVNNLASSLLYLRRIKDSIFHLESLIQDDPIRNMTDPVVFNLTTMYDLSCSHDLSGHKKKVLQSVAAVYHVYDLSYKSFRL